MLFPGISKKSKGFGYDPECWVLRIVPVTMKGVNFHHQV